MAAVIECFGGFYQVYSTPTASTNAVARNNYDI